MKNITKKQSAEAKKALDLLFKQYGIVRNRNVNSKFSHYPYVMNTKAGFLFIHPEVEAGHACLTMFCVFDDVQEANKIIPATNSRLNRWSGKFNFHEPSVAYLINQFKLEINPIKMKSNTQPIFDKVTEAMQEAEEMGAVSSTEDYVSLMDMIIAEATTRKKNALANKSVA